MHFQRYGLCWQGSADAIFMTFTPLQCTFSAHCISPSLISIAIQMLTFKATSHTGHGAGLQISGGVEWTAEVKEVEDGEAGRSAYVLRRRLGNPANLSLTSTSPTLLLLLLHLLLLPLLLLHPHLPNELPRTPVAKESGFSRLLESRAVPPLPFCARICWPILGLPPRPHPWVNHLLPIRPFLSAFSPVLVMIQFWHHSYLLSNWLRDTANSHTQNMESPTVFFFPSRLFFSVGTSCVSPWQWFGWTTTVHVVYRINLYCNVFQPLVCSDIISIRL